MTRNRCPITIPHFHPPASPPGPHSPLPCRCHPWPGLRGAAAPPGARLIYGVLARGWPSPRPARNVLWGHGPAPLQLEIPRDSVWLSITDGPRLSAVLAGAVPSCHLHSVPPRDYTVPNPIFSIGIAAKARVPKYPCPAAGGCPPGGGSRGCPGSSSPLLGVPIHGDLQLGHIHGAWGDARSQCHGETCGGRWSFAPVLSFQSGL